MVLTYFLLKLEVVLCIIVSVISVIPISQVLTEITRPVIEAVFEGIK